MAALFSRSPPPSTPRCADLHLSSKPIAGEILFCYATSVISGLVLAAAVLAVFHYRFNLAGKAVAIYIYNNASLPALIKGESPPRLLPSLSQLFGI